MNNAFKTFIGCSLIHLCIGSVYAMSVLYPQAMDLTGWNNSVLIIGFSLTILALGFTASLHQKWFRGRKKVSVLCQATSMWLISNMAMGYNIFGEINSEMLHYFFSIILGIAIGLLYVIPINISTTYRTTSGNASGLIVCFFGVGSILASKLYSSCDLSNSVHVLLYVLCYTIILSVGIKLIREGLKEDTILVYDNTFKRDKNWYVLALMFFFNIGIGISLLSNLTQLSLLNGFSMEYAIFLVGLAGLFNAFGRFLYPTLVVMKNIGRFRMVDIITDLQAFALFVLIISSGELLWGLSVAVVISVYGGMFALMPSLMKQVYNDTNAYSQILSMWGLAGLICPIIFNWFGLPSLLIMCAILLFCNGYLELYD